MFTELLPLLADRTLILTIARIDHDLIRVNVVPKSVKDNDNGEKALTTPLSVTGSAADLDRDLPAQLAGFAVSIKQTGSNLAQVQEAHRAARKEIEADNKKVLDSKRKISAAKAPPTSEVPPATGPVFKDGKPVFGSKPEPAAPGLFDVPAREPVPAESH